MNATTCGCCGETIANFPPDLAFQLPDAIWALDENAREARATITSDLCDLDQQRFFIRSILFVPLFDRGDRWGLGLWVEASRENFMSYLERFEDSEGLASFEGTVANDLPMFPGALGTSVRLHFGDSKQRPTLNADSASSLGQVQTAGMTDGQLHKAIGKQQ